MKIRINAWLIMAFTTALSFQPLLSAKAINLPIAPMTGTEPVVWVDDDYSPDNTGTHIWGVNAFDTIQAGVDAAASGGTVNVAPGLYPEDVQIRKSINLIGDKGDTQPGPGTNAPTIGGCPQIPTPVLFCNGISFDTLVNGSFSNVLIEGFIIRDHNRSIGAGDIGGFGIKIKNEGTSPMSNIIIQDNLFIDNRWESIMFFSIGNDANLYYDNVKALNNRVENTSSSDTAWVGIECTNCRNSLIKGNFIEGKVEKGIWIASESQGTNNPGFTNGMGVIVTENTVNGATTAAVELESFDTVGGLSDPVLSGVTVTGNTFNRTSSIGTQGEYLIFVHRNGFGSTSNATVNNITISNNQMDHSYGAFAAIYATVADQLTITGNTITTTAHLWQQGAAILLYNNGGDNLISENQITILNIGTTSTAGIALAYTSAVPGNSENFIISRNTITSASPLGSAGIHLTPGFSGASTKSVTISENRIIGFYNSLRFENTTDSHTFTIQGNSFSGNLGGVSSTLSAPLTLENNWWGCNAGPGQPGCDTITGLADANPWLVLTFSPGVTSLAPTANLPLASHLLTNSNGQDISGLGVNIPSMQSAFTSNLGIFNPVTAGFVVGSASSTYTAPAAPGVASLCAQVDNQQVCNGLFIANQLLFLPSVLR